MFPAAFDYRAVTSLDEAIAVLSEAPDTTKVLSGGQSLVPLLKLRLVQPDLVLDINGIPGLDRITDEGDEVVIGTLVRHYQFETDPVIAQYMPWLAPVAPLIADRQVRSLGTLAGTLVEADPTGDWSAAMLALNAQVDVAGPDGERTIPVREWFTYAFTPALDEAEIVTRVRIPKPAQPSAGAYVKLEKRPGDFAVAGCAVSLDLATDGTFRSVAVGFTAVGSVPVCYDEIGALFVGSSGEPDVLDAAQARVTELVTPMSDMRGSEDYKRDMAGVVFRRTFTAAIHAWKGSPS